MNRRVTLVLLVSIVCAGLTLTRFRAPAANAAAPDGKAIFAAKCAACHQATGLGGGPYPPLAGNPDVNAADTANLIATVLNGRSGPITVNGKQDGGAMPAWRGQLSKAEIAPLPSVES